MFEKNKKCKKCNCDIDEYDFDRNKGFCDGCKYKVKINKTIKTGFLFGLIAFLLFLPIIYIDYNYDLDRCSNLQSSETEYGFSHTVELNAEYSEACYYLRNHPLAIVERIVLLPLMGAILIGLFVSMIIMFKIY